MVANERLIPGAWDTHVHAGPDISNRKHNALNLARFATNSGMGGLVLKNHYFPTAMLARLVKGQIGVDIKIASSIVLNSSVGGLNEDVVSAAARMGVKRVELPTMAAKHNMLEQNESQTIELLKDGELTDQATTILDTAIDCNLVVGTGHISVNEVIAVVDYVRNRGGSVVITHPELHAARDGIGISLETQESIVGPGVYFERCYIVTDETITNLFLSEASRTARNAFRDSKMFTAIVNGIEATGSNHNLISTDYGQSKRASPPTALTTFHDRLLKAGITKKELTTMARENPAQLFE